MTTEELLTLQPGDIIMLSNEYEGQYNDELGRHQVIVDIINDGYIQTIFDDTQEPTNFHISTRYAKYLILVSKANHDISNYQIY